ncbi:MAG: S41 family peptidase [Balneolaceae bacterium]
MTLKKFLAPHLVVLLILSGFWLTGFDAVVIDRSDDQKNIQKYMQVQRRVIDNYYGTTDLEYLFERSIVGFVNAMEDSTLSLSGTPIDTTFTAGSVRNLRDALNRFEDAYLYVANNFPDKNMDRLTEESIRAMMSSLDPHSVYIEPEDSERIQEEFAGKFQGIGIQFEIIRDTITVVTPISGGPSDQLGIMSGDRIIKIDDSTAVGFTNEDVQRKLRGPKGTEVTVQIQRPRTSNPVNLTIVRDDIPLTTLDTSYMIDNRTGYIKISRFAATTHDEFITAVQDLQEQGMERIILDMRGNPGGFLSQAIAITEEFFPRGTKLVSTESRHRRFNSEAYSTKDGILRSMPVIALVNEGSASASEIVSGAIQDHDRGLVVGRRTFGKGLVQQQYELVDNSNIRVTISRYLTPSGRMIQKPFDDGSEEYAFEIFSRSNDASIDATKFKEDVPDSLRFSTASGRTVFGGGGIIPDFIVQRDTTMNFLLFNYMMANRVHLDLVRSFLDEQGDTFRAEWEADFNRFKTDYSWPEPIQQRFLEQMTEAGMVIDNELDDIEIRDNDIALSQERYNELVWMNFGRMKAELARQVWGNEKFHPVDNIYLNEPLTEAMKLWDEVTRLETLAQQSSLQQQNRNRN